MGSLGAMNETQVAGAEAIGASGAAGAYETAEPASLDELRGAHPSLLRDLYCGGRPADPTRLGAARGALLAFEPVGGILSPPPALVALLSRHLPWRGKAFAPDGSGGANMLLRWRLVRFACAPGPSEIDGQPTLLLRYDGIGNPWPVSAVADELRQVGERVCLGPASLRHGSRSSLLFWWGVEVGAVAT
jgi:hypothetical protein